MPKLDERALSDAAREFIDSATSAGTPLSPALWSHLKQHLRAAIITYQRLDGIGYEKTQTD